MRIVFAKAVLIIAVGFLIAVHAAIATGFAGGFSRGSDQISAYIGWLFVVSCLWGAVFALCRLKNRDSYNWLVAAVFFGPIPLAVLPFMPRKQHRAEELHECPHCLSEIPIRAFVCRFCQRDVAVLGSSAAASEAPLVMEVGTPAPITADCKYCGSPGAEIPSLDGSYYHKACHTARYNEATGTV